MNNWTVITQPVKWQSKGLFLRERYLTSTTHSNHKYTEKIISICGNQATVKIIALMGEQFNLRRTVNNSRGRRLESYAMEFCLTLPKNYRPNSESWRNVIDDICVNTRKYCKLTQEEFKRFKSCVRAVLHQQDQSIKVGAGDHIHLILPKVVFDGDDFRILKELQRKQFTKIIKNIYTSSVLKNFGYRIEDYSPKHKNTGKKLEIWKANKQELDSNITKNKILLRMINQMEKWFLAFEEKNEKQMNRQLNRIKKSYLNCIAEDSLIPDSTRNTLVKIESLSNKNIIN
ncbi:hypothetical protein CGK41_16175 [Vibrio parahaemolyticus]|uniref:hypothetical protein n=1 Tax=Vibrio parahaemolyticus TaxID=670 RepID=UPI00111E43E8|nr:hypothetical protein [Vibrio parahaemolyticus]TNZ71745.1 hypothetical protein CGK41_16175 [Vibrio parahaemolyticus]